MIYMLADDRVLRYYRPRKGPAESNRKFDNALLSRVPDSPGSRELCTQEISLSLSIKRNRSETFFISTTRLIPQFFSLYEEVVI